MISAANKKAGQKPVTKKAGHQARTNPVTKSNARQKPETENDHNNRHHHEPAQAEHFNLFISGSADTINLLEIIKMVRIGIDYDFFIKLFEYTPFTMAEWASFLQLSTRTMQRNQKERKPFQPVQSERIVKLSMLYKYGVKVFGNQ